MGLFKKDHSAFCAFCRSPRKLNPKKSMGFFDILVALIFCIYISYLIFGDLDPRSIVVFAILVSGYEAVVRLRWRLSVRCTQCGFDPVVYKNDPEKAAELVNEHMRRRQQNQKSIFHPVHLPVRKVKK